MAEVAPGCFVPEDSTSPASNIAVPTRCWGFHTASEQHWGHQENPNRKRPAVKMVAFHERVWRTVRSLGTACTLGLAGISEQSNFLHLTPSGPPDLPFHPRPPSPLLLFFLTTDLVTTPAILDILRHFLFSYWLSFRHRTVAAGASGFRSLPPDQLASCSIAAVIPIPITFTTPSL